MSKQLVGLALLAAVLATNSGCRCICSLHDNLLAAYKARRWCDCGCGSVYYGPWISDPPCCQDPCDCCGNFNGQPARYWTPGLQQRSGYGPGAYPNTSTGPGVPEGNAGPGAMPGGPNPAGPTPAPPPGGEPEQLPTPAEPPSPSPSTRNPGPPTRTARRAPRRYRQGMPDPYQSSSTAQPSPWW